MDQQGLCMDSIISPGTLILTDLTDPFLTSIDANGIFQVVLVQFRAVTGQQCGKVVAFDEARKSITFPHISD
jgi:hypothetical protein